MKKVIIITLLMTVIATLFIGGGVCYAEESQTNYYYVAKGSELTVRSAATEEANIIMQIPSTYAVQVIEKADGFVHIKYNDCDGYVSDANFNQYCKPVTSKWGESPYFYTISLNISNVTTDQLTLYDKSSFTPSSALKTMVTIDKVYGYYRRGNDYYFLVDTTANVFGSTINNTGFIKASDTTLADFTKDSITDSAGYLAETAPTEQPNNGDDNTPTLNPSEGDGTTLPATNNFERYVLIAVIAVLCIVIIILIFAPNKSKRRPQ